jgi:hypothetical protein
MQFAANLLQSGRTGGKRLVARQRAAAVGRQGGDVTEGASKHRNETDALGVLTWALRTYAPVVMLSVLLLGVIVPVVLGTAPQRYSSQAEVGPVSALNLKSLDPLPRLGQTVFNNGAVAEAVRGVYDPPLPDDDMMIPTRVDLVAPQDNVAFTVVGKGPTADEAADVANVAAATFTEELNKYEEAVGTFAVQRPATPSPAPVSASSPALAIVGGVLAGLILGISAVIALVAWRRPVLDAATAERVAGVPLLGIVEVDDHHDAARGVEELSRKLRLSSYGPVYMTGPAVARTERQLLADLLKRMDGHHGIDAQSLDEGAEPTPTGSTTTHLNGERIVEDPTMHQLAGRPSGSLVLCVAPIGIPENTLRRASETRFGTAGSGVVLVRHRRPLGVRLKELAERARQAGRRRSPRSGRGSDTERPS